MTTIKTKDGADIFYKDWGPKDAQPIVFHHGWPLSGDDWDAQMLFFLKQGYRVIAHDRRGQGRSSQTADGHDMDTYAADVAALADKLDLRGATHVGHSTGGGEATRYVAKYGKKQHVAKLVLLDISDPVLRLQP
jgi:non-heme chloroperoxidase